MKNKKIKISSILFNLALIFLVLFSQSKIVLAESFDISDISKFMGFNTPLSILSEIIEDLGLDQETLTDYTENMEYKKTPPQVSLFFSPTAPNEGEEITATASPSYFKNDTKDLYFTWFLKGADCTDKELDGSNYKYNSKCDLDDNGRVDIEDYKVRAARIIANGGFLYEEADYENGSDDDGYEAPSGGNDQRGKNAYCFVMDNVTGEEYEMDSCGSKHDGTRHLFPNFDDDRNGGATGDGIFGRDEEKFWHTDPNSSNTARLGNGNVDEANVAGLGVLNFSWNYEKGDKVGVVVEGVSTDIASTPDSSYKTMWAMSNRTYSEKKDGNIDDPSDLNDLLYDALVSPSENTAGSDMLDIILSASPDNPINDPTGEDTGDMLTITASVTNAKNNDSLDYSWKVYASNEVNPKEWGDSNSPQIPKSDLPESGLSNGRGIDTFKFKLAIEKPEGSGEFNYKFLRVLVTISEDIGEENPRKNNKAIIIPVILNTGDQISAHVTSAASSTNQFGVNLSLGDQICNTKETEKAICPVVKNQIIGLSIPASTFDPNTSSFFWTIDGKTFSYSSCYFDGCKEDHQVNIAYFPVLKELGEEYTVNLIAEKANGEKTNLTRIFKVVEPSVKIVSDDPTVCYNSLLGEYEDTEGGRHKDYSESSFWANICANKIKIKATPEGEYNWIVDGIAINSTNAPGYGFELSADNVLSLPPKENLSESYNVTANIVYSQNNLIKKALNKVWDVPYNKFYEKPLSAEANITMIECDPNSGLCDSNQNPSKKIFATISSSAPAYLAFLFRIVITISLILFTTKLVFSFLPKIDAEED